MEAFSFFCDRQRKIYLTFVASHSSTFRKFVQHITPTSSTIKQAATKMPLACHCDASFVSTGCGAICELRYKKGEHSVNQFTTIILLQSTDPSFLRMPSKRHHRSSYGKEQRGIHQE
jgi:hypothetical protein